MKIIALQQLLWNKRIVVCASINFAWKLLMQLGDQAWQAGFLQTKYMSDPDEVLYGAHSKPEQ